MSVWKDILAGLLVFLLEAISVSFFGPSFPPFYYVNALVPLGVLYLYKGSYFLPRFLFLIAMAFFLDVFSFSPFGLWLLKVSFFLGITFFWVEVFSRGFVSLVVFFAVYPFLELFIERFVVLPVIGSGGFVLSWALLGKLVNVFLSLSLFFLLLADWRDYDVE